MENAPTSISAVEKLKFKLLCQLQVTPPGASFPCSTPTRLVATSSKYGLIFVGDAQGFQCIQTNSIIEIVHGRPKSQDKLKTYPRREIPLGCAPSHLDVSGDGETLAVTSTIQGCPFLIFYRIASFGAPNFEKSCQVRLSSTENVWVVDLQWNPGIANMIGAVTSDGAAIVCELTQNGPVINTIPPNSQSLCLCWSPKGKRVVIGSKGGSIMQYMPELKVVKAIPTPSFPQKNMNIISIRWLSNTQFIAVYKDSQDQSGSSAVIVINAPPNKEPQFINYDDMFCGGLTERSEHYFIHIPQWNMIILGNGNALESAVLCQENDLWVQWSIDDGFRAELPLSDNHADVYNVGMAVDFSPQYQVSMDENMILGPRPLLLMYSHIGVLCLFHSLNFVPGAPELCIQPQNLPRNFFTEKQQEAQVAAPPVMAQPVMAPQVTQAPVSTQSSFQFSMPNFGPPTTGQTMGLTMQGQPFSSGQTPFNFSTASQLSQFASPPKTVQTPQVSSSFQQVQQQPKIELPKTVEPPKTPAAQPSGIDLGSLLGQNKASDFGIQPSFGLPQTQITGTPQKPLLNKPEAPVSVPSQPSQPVKETPKEAEKPSAEALEKARKEKEKALIDAMVKEFKVVDLEFKDYKKKISNFNLTIGDDSFLSAIPSKVADFETFERDLSETTGTQSAEVNILRCNLVELYGYVENIKARDRHVKSQRYLECLESQSLDPITKKHIKNIEQQMHFVDSQIKQATAHLDAIWTSHKNSKAKDTLDIPNMESIYQAMVSQSHILTVQKNIVNDQYNKLRQHLKRVKKIPQVIEYSSPSYNAKTGESNLDILADKLLHTTLDSKSPSKSFKETSCRYIVLANAKKNLSPSKEKCLGLWHKSHKLITTKPVRPFGNEDDDFLQTPSPASVIEKTPEPSKPHKTDFQKSFSSSPQSSVLVKEINKTVAPEKGTKSAEKVDKTIPTFGDVSSSTPVKPTHSMSTTPLSTPFSSWASSPLSTKPFAQLSLPNEAAVTKSSKPETTSIFGGSSQFNFSTPKAAVTTPSPTLSNLIQKEITPKITELKPVESKEAKSAVPLKTTTPAKAATPTPLFGSNSFTLSPATSLKNVSSESVTSIFGGSTASTTPSLFSGVNSLSFSSLAVSTTANATVSSTSTPSKAVTTSVTTTTQSVFNLSSLNTGQTSIFSTQTTSAPSGSIFGGLPSATTVFAVTTSSAVFGSSPSIFGGQIASAASDTVSTTSAPIFGGTGTALSAFSGTPTTAALPATTSMFGGSTNTATTVPSLTTTASLFGGTTTSTTTSLFGNTTATTTSIFGATTASPSSMFGGTTTTASTTSLFAGTTTTASTISMLAGTTTTSTTSLFAATTTTASTTSLFAGTTTTASTTSLFAGTTTTASTTSMFAGTTTTTTATTSSFSAPLFGTTPTTNVFGTATTASMFGGTASFGNTTATTTSSVFGSPTTSSSVFGTSFGTTVTTSSVFGGTATTSSVFGGTATTSVFGSPATTSSSVFGAANALSSTSFFGSPTTSSFQTPSFGQSPQQFSSSPFFQTTTPTTVQQNVFASTSFTQTTTASSIFGGSPTFAQSTGNIFGNAATPNKFNTSSGSLFGGSFTSPTQPQGFSSGQTGGLFGSNSSFQSSPQPQAGFGSPPAFGSGGSSIFGGQTSFGAAPTFGGSATFGSPKKVFGETAAAPSFGTPTQQSPTFENLAGQNTLSFGNLAQNQSSFGSSFGTPPQNQQPAFPTSTFGGSSFSSWR